MSAEMQVKYKMAARMLGYMARSAVYCKTDAEGNSVQYWVSPFKDTVENHIVDKMTTLDVAKRVNDLVSTATESFKKECGVIVT